MKIIYVKSCRSALSSPLSSWSSPNRWSPFSAFSCCIKDHMQTSNGSQVVASSYQSFERCHIESVTPYHAFLCLGTIMLFKSFIIIKQWELLEENLTVITKQSIVHLSFMASLNLFTVSKSPCPLAACKMLLAIVYWP